MRWNKDEELIAIELLKDGNSYDNIGNKLGRSRKSIKEKLNELGYRFEDFKDLYYYETKKCLKCEIDFKSLKSEERLFCSQSCSASYNNLNKIIFSFNTIYDNKSLQISKIIEKRNEIKNCKNCEKNLNNNKNIFCSQTCQHKYYWELKKKEIEKGEVSLNKPLRKYKIEKDGHICQVCKMTEWNNKVIPLVLDHINGNSYNNFPDNLRMICPNCDAQTETYKGKNKGNGRFERMKRYYEGKSY